MMLTFRHYKFKQRLELVVESMAARSIGARRQRGVHQQDPQLGRHREHQAGQRQGDSRQDTGFGMDRDINGARGIFLRALGDSPFLRGLLMQVAAQTTAVIVECCSAFIYRTQQSAGSCANWNGSA